MYNKGESEVAKATGKSLRTEFETDIRHVEIGGWGGRRGNFLAFLSLAVQTQLS
jgi:hypothetical protein